MSSDFPETLVSTEWLAGHLADPGLRILDCTWHHASTNLDGRTQYRGRHIPGSVHFDIDHMADKSSPLPHMLPKPADFANRVGLLGIGNGDRVVVYDRFFGGSAAARAWWMFRVFGHDKVAMLDGSYVKWIGEKLPADMSAVRPEPQCFTAAFTPSLVRNISDMKANLLSGAEQVIDARGPGKFDGTQEDVFPFKKLGHIPDAINVPWADLVNPETGVFLPPDALRARFAAAGIDLARPIVTTCASGVTSCAVALGLYLLGHETAAVYDGSWAEWSLDADAPVVAALKTAAQ